jgi:hypothetical protein
MEDLDTQLVAEIELYKLSRGNVRFRVASFLLLWCFFFMLGGAILSFCIVLLPKRREVGQCLFVTSEMRSGMGVKISHHVSRSLTCEGESKEKQEWQDKGRV